MQIKRKMKMKKILIALAIAAFAGIVNAATVSWNLTNVMDSSDPTAKSTGYMVYVFATADSTGTFSLTTVDAIVSSINDGTFTGASAMSSAQTASGGAYQGNIGSFGAGDSISGFAVIFDAATFAEADNYIVTSVKTQSFTSSTGSKALAFGSQSAATWQAVPEPTSGLLMLVGLAGLALRRRRA